MAGLKVCVAAGKAEAAVVVQRTENALRLIARHDSGMLGQMQRNVRCFLFSDAPGAHYFDSIRTCRIGIGYAKRTSPLELAMMLVHEATHARLARDGVSYEDAASVERSCVEAEIEFARKVPGSEDAIEKTRALLQNEWWDITRHADSITADLIDRGIPRWLAQWIVARNTRR